MDVPVLILAALAPPAPVIRAGLVIDRFDVHESIVDEAPIAAGRHALRVEYFEHVGWAELRVEIVKP